eukprot:scpid71508/ scgid4577/ 
MWPALTSVSSSPIRRRHHIITIALTCLATAGCVATAAAAEQEEVHQTTIATSTAVPTPAAIISSALRLNDALANSTAEAAVPMTVGGNGSSSGRLPPTQPAEVALNESMDISSPAVSAGGDTNDDIASPPTGITAHLNSSNTPWSTALTLPLSMSGTTTGSSSAPSSSDDDGGGDANVLLVPSLSQVWVFVAAASVALLTLMCTVILLRWACKRYRHRQGRRRHCRHRRHGSKHVGVHASLYNHLDFNVEHYHHGYPPGSASVLGATLWRNTGGGSLQHLTDTDTLRTQLNADHTMLERSSTTGTLTRPPGSGSSCSRNGRLPNLPQPTSGSGSSKEILYSCLYLYLQI